MRYLTISEYGSHLGISSNCLVVKQSGEVIKEIALSRLRGVSILKTGVSLSGDLIQACAIRGIKIFFIDWRNRIYSAVIEQNQHAVVALRKAQFLCIENNERCFCISKSIVISKIKNQRSVLLYFSKYISQKDFQKNELLKATAERLKNIIQKIQSFSELTLNWKAALLGLEGSAAMLYWKTLMQTELLPKDFIYREGRGATSITNKALNYGYAILLSYVWSALDNAGLEVYAGFFHDDRPGKPSLVLDCIEEYRAWVVDRTIIKLRNIFESTNEFTPKLKKQVSDAIHQTMKTKYLYNKKKLKLENILQRQIYKLAGTISDNKKYHT